METRTLPHTGLTVSRACFGTMPFGTQADQATSTRMVDLCMDRGINFFDTANVYNHGAAEIVLGNALKGRRDKVVVASKVRMKMGDGPLESGLSRAAILKNVDESLTRLQTDYLDLYYLHAPDWSVRIEETLETMDQLVRAGKVRYPACSNYAGWQMVQILWISAQKGWQPPLVSQVMYNLLVRDIEQEFVAMCREFGVFITAYNPLAAGLLTGKHPPQRPIPGSRLDENKVHFNRYWHPDYFDAVDELRAVAERAGRTLIDLALNWLLCHTATDCVILGASTTEQLEQNLGAFGRGPLAPETLAACDAVWQKLRGLTPAYNR